MSFEQAMKPGVLFKLNSSEKYHYSGTSVTSQYTIFRPNIDLLTPKIALNFLNYASFCI